MPYLKIFNSMVEMLKKIILLTERIPQYDTNLDDKSIDDLNNIYNFYRAVNSMYNGLNKLTILRQQSEINIGNKELRFIQLVRTNRSRRNRINSIFFDKEVIESRIESQLKLSLLNEFKKISGEFEQITNANYLNNFNIFLQICIDNYNIEGHGYVKDKLIAIKDNQVGGNRLIERESPYNNENEFFINKIYRFEEYSISLFNIVFKILALDDETYIKLQTELPQTINIINHNLRVIINIYDFVYNNITRQDLPTDTIIHHIVNMISQVNNIELIEQQFIYTRPKRQRTPRKSEQDLSPVRVVDYSRRRRSPLRSRERKSPTSFSRRTRRRSPRRSRDRESTSFSRRTIKRPRTPVGSPEWFIPPPIE